MLAYEATMNDGIRKMTVGQVNLLKSHKLVQQPSFNQVCRTPRSLPTNNIITGPLITFQHLLDASHRRLRSLLLTLSAILSTRLTGYQTIKRSLV